MLSLQCMNIITQDKMTHKIKLWHKRTQCKGKLNSSEGFFTLSKAVKSLERTERHE